MKKAEKRKVVLIGTGMVGMSYAYAILNQNLCDELVLIDINKKKAEGEAMDLNHGVAFSGGNMEIYAGEYSDCRDADLIVLTAGLPQKERQSRLDLLKENRKIFESILHSVLQSGFCGIFLVATNPVDIMTRIVYEISGFSPEKVIGTGTALDTARLRYLLGEKFMIDPRNMHAYVMGEHGDSEFVPWSQAMMATKPIFDLCGETKGCHFQELLELEEEVRMAAYKIIEAKKATYYGIGMYGEEDKDSKAKENKHMTFSEAAALAKDAEVAEMWLTHFSPSLVRPQEYIRGIQKIFENVTADGGYQK